MEESYLLFKLVVEGLCLLRHRLSNAMSCGWKVVGDIVGSAVVC